MRETASKSPEISAPQRSRNSNSDINQRFQIYFTSSHKQAEAKSWALLMKNHQPTNNRNGKISN
jgi:hypothetical protein